MPQTMQNKPKSKAQMFWRWLLAGGATAIIGFASAIATTSYTAGMKKAEFNAKIENLEKTNQEQSKILQLQFKKLGDLEKKIYELEIRLVKIEANNK